MNLHIRCLHQIIYEKKNGPTDSPYFCHERANKHFFFLALGHKKFYYWHNLPKI